MKDGSRRFALDGKRYESIIGISLRSAERELEEAPAVKDLFDITYADTKRFPPPEWALEEFSRAASGGAQTYTPYRGDPSVLESVATNIEEVLKLKGLTKRNVLLAPGTQGALFVALATAIQPGDKVMLPEPDYLSTERILEFLGAEVIRVPVLHHGDERAELDTESIHDALRHGSRLLVFSHPNNPTGCIYSRDNLLEVSRLVNQFDAHVIADELYCRLVYDGESFDHIANFEGMADRTVTLLGPSKTESLSGYRLGVAVGHAQKVAAMEDLQSLTALRAPAYAQHLLSRWLKDDQELVCKRIAEYQDLRDTTYDRLHESGVLKPEHVWGTAYMFVGLPNKMRARTAALALKQQAGIVVNPGFQFGRHTDSNIRICFAQDEARWNLALDQMIEIVGNLDQNRDT